MTKKDYVKLAEASSRVESAVSYRVFVRNWWRWETNIYTGHGDTKTRHLVPDPGARKTTLATHCTFDEAQSLAKAYNASHKPGSLSRKAEFEEK